MKLGFLAAIAAAAFVSFAPVAVEQAAAAPPQVQIIGPTDLFQDIVGGNAQVGNVYASAIQLAGFANAQPNTVNALIGGDAGTNLFQRGTTGASVTTTVTYGGPDRWAYWSGTATAMTVSKDTTAADIPASGYTAGFKMARTSGQTGVIQTCMAQEVETANAVQFQGNIAELDFHADAGANFSAAASSITAYIITGTGTDEGMQKLAWGLNAGGGGSTAWAGQANATAAVIPISTANGRYAAVAAIPTTATEIGVALCFTPVGTAGTNDFVTFAGIQLVRNPALTPNTTLGYVCGTTTGMTTCTAYDRRPAGFEALLQQRYFYGLSEVAVSNALYAIAPCAVSTTSLGVCLLKLPVTMRVAPTMTYTTGFGMTVAAQTSAVACTGLATAGGSGLSLVASPDAVPITCSSSAGFGAAGTAAILTNMASTSAGKIQANAEF